MKILLSALTCLLLAFIPTTVKTETADVVFKSGNIYTVNERQPQAEAIAVKGDRIVFVGSNIDVQKYVGTATRVIDLAGHTVVPGLTDAHHHLSGVGFREMTLNLEGITTLDEFLTKIKAKTERARPGEWISGRGWIETFWKPPVFPTRWDLDNVTPNNPAFFTRADGHALVANSAALKLAGIDRNTASPFGGEVLKDKQSGEPTGMLIDAAQGLLRSHVPPSSAEDEERAIILGVKRNLELGWCQIQDAGGSYADVDLYRKLYGAGRIKLRIYKAVYGPGPDAARLLREGPSIGEFGNRFTLRAIKVVSDGALGSRGAALLEPYSDDPGNTGLLRVKEESLLPMLEEALRKGVQVETHAIGDRANRFMLDVYEKAFNSVPVEQRKIREPRWRDEHTQIVNPADLPRFARLGIIPSMQPSHAIGDLFFAPRRLGMNRLVGAYAWQSLLKTGAIIAGGTDAPVERGEPMIEFYAAVARKDQKGFQGEGWHPEEAVTRQQALKMFTIWAAYAGFEEKLKGSIQAGKLADLTVLSADIMKVPELDILKTHCLMTVIGGEIVYEAK